MNVLHDVQNIKVLYNSKHIISLFDNVISIFPGFRYLPCIIFLTRDNFALLRLHVWIPRGKHDLPTITPNGRAQDWRMCASYNAGDAAFAVRYALRNATTGGGDNEDDDMSRVLPMANLARVRDFISRPVRLCRELDIVSLARKDPKANYTDRQRLHTGICMHKCMSTSPRRFRGDRNAQLFQDHRVSSHIFQRYNRSSI